MHLIDVLNKCQERHYPISKQGLYHVGRKNGFITKGDDFHVEFDKDKFLAWLDRVTQSIPEGYVTIKDLSVMYKISLSQCYALVKDDDCVKVVIGRKGQTYVKPESIKAVIEKRNSYKKYDWGNN